MKKGLILMFSALIATGISCKKTNTQNELPTIRLTGEITQQDAAKMSASRAVASKAGFAAGDKVGICIVPYLSMAPETVGTLHATDNYAHNFPFITTDGTGFAPDGTTITFPNATTKVDIYGFGMYDDDLYKNLGANPKAKAWTIEADQSTAAAVRKSDVMTARTQGVSPSDASVTLQFHHRLAKTEITFTAPSTFRGNAVTGVELYVDNTKLSTVLDMTDPAVDAGAASGNIIPIKAYKADVTGQTHIFEAIIVPQTVATGEIIARVVLTVANLGTQTLECRTSADITYAKAVNTKMAITFENEYLVSLGAVTIAPWTEQTVASVDARRPNRMIFGFTGSTANADKVKFVKLTIENGTDATDYTVAVEKKTATLECQYLPSKTHTGGEVTAVQFLEADGTTPVTATLTPALPQIIPGDPTRNDYALQITSATF